MRVLWPLVLLLGACSAEAPVVPGAPVHPERPARVIDDRGVDVLDYEIQLRVSATSTTIAGTTAIRFRVVAPAPLEGLRLDFVGYQIDGVQLDGRAAAAERGAVRPGFGEDALWIPGVLVPDSEHLVRIDYHGRPPLRRTPSTSVNGLLIGFQGFGGDEVGIPLRLRFTQNQPEGARLWFPSVDQPSDKATLRTIVEVPEPLEAISNGVLEGGGPERFDLGGEPWLRYRWREDRAIATYLVHVSVGEFASSAFTSAGVEVLNFHPTTLDGTAVRAALEPSDEALQMLTGLLGPYPFARYGHVLIDEGEPPPGMENQTTTVIDARLLTQSDPEILEGALVHELAHHWFGNALTPTDHRMYWFNEGLASFFELLYLERRYDFLRQLRSNLRPWRELTRQYWRRFGEDALLADLPDQELLGPAVYGKAPIVMTTLRAELGEDVLLQALRALVEQKRYGNVAPEDLEQAVTAAAGRDMSWFFDQWIYSRGIGIVKYGCRSRTAAALARGQVDCTFRQLQGDLEQVRKFMLDAGAAPPAAAWPLFRIRVPIYYSSADVLPEGEALPDDLKVEYVRLEPQATQTFSFCVDQIPAWIGPDAGLETYAVFQNGLAVEETDFVCY